MGRRAKPAKVKAKAENLETRLAESLERETATGEILSLIGATPMDARPVFDGIARSGVKVCGAQSLTLFVVDGDTLRVAATHGVPAERVERFRTQFPVPLSAENHVAQVLRERRIFHLADIEHNPAATPEHLENARLGGYRTRLMIPLLRGDRLLGLIAVTHQSPAPFPDQQIALLKTFADQAVIAIENVRLFTELETRNRDLTTALDRQTATAEILRVISRSPIDVQPVFDAIVRNAVRLCDATYGDVYRFDGTMVHFVAHHNFNPEQLVRWQQRFPRAPGGGIGRVIETRGVLRVSDVHSSDGAVFGPAALELMLAHGTHSALLVPMSRNDAVIGVITLTHRRVGAFTEAHVELLQTFADQAVIAIENVRLFTELQEKNEALTQAHAQVSEALEQQTATSEILRVISRSPTNVQPVFDSIAQSAVRLCGSTYCFVFRVEAESLHIAAYHGVSHAGLAELRRRYPAPLSAPYNSLRSVRERRVIQLTDADTDQGLTEGQRRVAQMEGYRSQMFVPMLQGDRCVGVIGLTRTENEPFPETQVGLLKTFADQAVIAIENVRLFTELQEKNEALTQAHAQVSEALEQQTATGEILRVIASSPTDVQPVLDAIARSVVRLCDGLFGAVFRFDGELLHFAAHYNFTPTGLEAFERVYPVRLTPEAPLGPAILERRIVHIPDTLANVSADYTRPLVKALGHRSLLAVPMLRGETPLGTINVARATSGPFTDTQIELLKTFADQAVIAIENVRLFTELQASNRELTTALDTQTATSDILRVISRSQTDVQPVFDAIMASAVRLLGGYSGALTRVAGDQIELAALTSTDDAGDAALRTFFPQSLRSEGPNVQAIRDRAPVNIADAQTDPRGPEVLRVSARARGYRSAVVVPMLHHDAAIGAISVARREAGGFTDDEIALLQTFADQAVIAIENARLLTELHARTAELTRSVGEIEDKSRQLEAASRHKSEFLANMSHELRTPLNAIIGFSEVLTERMFGELNDKQDEYLKDIYASGQHLLSLINDILDLSKIEAGRMELEPADFDLPGAIDNALILVRERAGRRGIALGRAIDERVGTIHADERKVKQVLLNLLSNALKFTPEGGRIDVGAAVSGGMVEVSVADTGVGIAPEDQETVFEEFRQVGTADKKVEGTGLGLALSRKFIELHGGRIWVKSQAGTGSTFTFTIPTLHE